MGANAGVYRFQFHRMIRAKAWRYAVVAGLVAVTVCFAQSCLLFWGHDVGELPSADVAWVGNYESMRTPLICFYLIFLAPFLAASAFGDSLFTDIRRRFAGCVAVRSSLRAYVFSGAAASFVGGFAVVLVPLAFSQLLAFSAFPVAAGQDAYLLFPNTSAAEADVTSWYEQTFLVGLFVNNRYLLNLLFVVYDALWGGLMGMAAFSLSLHVRASRLVVVGAPALALILSSLLLPRGMSVSDLFLLSLVIPRDLTFFCLAPLVVLALELAALYAPLLRKQDVLL